MCKQKEDLEHFMEKCPILDDKRYPDIMEPWKNMDTQTKTANILLKGKNHGINTTMIQRMWEFRKELLKQP